MRLRRLTETGISRFREYIAELKSNPTLPAPFDLLDEPSASEPVDGELEVQRREFANKLEAARYLHSVLADSELELVEVERDVGLWSWLALFYFDQLCPVGKAGERGARAVVRYVPSVTNFRRYYRHLLLGPYVIYDAYQSDPDEALALLQGALHLMTDIVEQLASRRERVTNRAVVGAATRLYIDPDSREFKPNARGKGAGSAVRLSTVLDQFDLTYDLCGMTPNELLALLPNEFNRFRN